jgi:glutamine amidotransferase
VTSRAILAAVRNATTGMPVLEAGVAPFAEGRWLFSHNGAVTGWPDSMAKLAERLPTRDLLALEAPTDAALLWALVRARLRTGTPPADSVAETVAAVAGNAPGSRLNLLLTDGSQIVATTAGHALSVRRTAGHVLVSSEPLDDDAGWEPVPEGKLVVATPTHVDITEWGSQ